MTVSLDAFPTDEPVWATDEVNNTEPTEGKKALGWEVDEEPASSFFNWWQKNVYDWIVHYKQAIQVINDGKVDIDGDTMTGPLVMDGTQIEVGTTDGDASTVQVGPDAATINDHLLKFGSAGYIASHTRPQTTTTYDLGSSSKAWRALYAQSVSLRGGDVAPGTAGVGAVGSNTLPFSAMVARAMRTRTLASYQNTPTAADATALISTDQNKCIVACGSQTSTTSTANLSARHFNVDTIVRDSVGVYTVTFDQPVDDDAAMIVTALWLTQVIVGNGIIATGGATATVRVKEHDGAGPFNFVDAGFSFVVVGSPQSYVADPIS